MNRFTFVDCATVDEALSQMKGDAVVKAGGIDLLDLMKDGIVRPPKLVSIRNVQSLHRIASSDRGLELGPLTTLSEIAEHSEIQQRYAALSDAAGHAATPQVRNMATLGGNLMQRPRCWYFRSTDFDCRKKGTSDECHALEGENQYHAIVNNKSCAMVHPSSTAVPLLAMDAEVELTSKAGKRTVAMRDFYVAPEVDLQMDGKTCRKAAIVLGVAAPTPIHATDAEAALRGKVIDERTAREAGRLAVANATPLSQNGYKVQLFQTAVYRTILLAAGQMGRDPSAVG
jgi:xanthine dehydrogenase YagS FAD-binding subunit